MRTGREGIDGSSDSTLPEHSVDHDYPSFLFRVGNEKGSLNYLAAELPLLDAPGKATVNLLERGKITRVLHLETPIAVLEALELRGCCRSHASRGPVSCQARAGRAVEL